MTKGARRGIEAAFGRERWNAPIDQIMSRHNAAWPDAQAPDAARLPAEDAA